MGFVEFIMDYEGKVNHKVFILNVKNQIIFFVKSSRSISPSQNAIEPTQTISSFLKKKIEPFIKVRNEFESMFFA